MSDAAADVAVFDSVDSIEFERKGKRSFEGKRLWWSNSLLQWGILQANEINVQAIEYAPYNPKLYSNRCTAHLLLHQYDEALKDAEKCVSLDPDWAKGHVQLGSCYAGMGKYAEAKKHYLKGKFVMWFSGIALPLSDTKETVEKLIKDVLMSVENYA